ncbi:MAG TPA: DUF1820 family protein [Thermoanaerobaculia bacterium]|nr:DUF1820 family protein [Thermoanaerobaculia bacterium]
MAAASHIYRVTFLNQGNVYEVYARHVGQGGLFGFVEIEELLWSERSKLVIDPSEDRLRTEFEGVKRFHVPMHAVLRIDEVEREGVARISPAPSETGKVANFPVPLYTPRGDGGGKG